MDSLGGDCAAILVEVWRLVGTTEFASGSADAAAAVTEGSEPRVEMKMELKTDCDEEGADEGVDDAVSVLIKTSVPVRLIGMTVRPPVERSVVKVEADASAGAEDNASADA